MSRRRMFSDKIVDTDAFLDMGVGSQNLYFHLGMRADDDGFVSNPKKIMRMVGAQEDDYKVLIAKRFIIQFESGICVIKHWLIHNLIRGDRYTETQYIKEKNQLMVDEKTNKYSLIKELATNDIPVGTQSAPQVRLGKVRLGKDSIEREQTPSQEANDFFSNAELQESFIAVLVEKGILKDVASREVKKFISYWTELNKSGTKKRWELEKTFEVKRRLITWFGNIKTFKGQQGKITPIIK